MDTSPRLSGRKRRWCSFFHGLCLAWLLLAEYLPCLLLYGGGSNPSEVHCVGSKGTTTGIPRRGLIFPGTNVFQHVLDSVIPQSNTVEIQQHQNTVNPFGPSVFMSLPCILSEMIDQKTVLHVWSEISHVDVFNSFQRMQVHQSLPEVQLSMQNVRKKQMKEVSAERLPTRGLVLTMPFTSCSLPACQPQH